MYYSLQIKYAAGKGKQLVLRSKGIPLGITPENARAVLDKGFRRQPVKQEKIDKLKVIKAYVLGYIDKLGTHDDKHEWEEFFNKIIPTEPLTEGNCPLSHDSYLHKLYAEYGGPPRRKSRVHERTRCTLSKYTEPMVFPEAAFTQEERDTTAQFAVSHDFTNNLLVEKGDLKRVSKKRTRKTLKDDKQRVKILAPKKRCRTSKMSKSKQKKKAKWASVSDDEESLCSGSTMSSTYAPSMKSGDDSDLGCGFSDTEDGSIASTVDSSFSISDVPKLPERMKCKEIATSYKAKIGKRFRDLENGVVYRIFGLCKLDNDDFYERSTYLVDKLMFKYHADNVCPEDEDFDVAEDIETTLCSEMMDATCNSVQWLEEE